MPGVTGTRSRSLVYDRGLPVSVNLQTVHPRKVAAARREVAPGAVGSAWGPALGKVWEFRFGWWRFRKLTGQTRPARCSFLVTPCFAPELANTHYSMRVHDP